MPEVSEIVDGLRSRIQGNPAPEGVEIHRCSRLKLTIGELRAAIKSNTNHPKASAFMVTVANSKSDADEVVVDTPDIQALIDNCDLDVKRYVENGRQIVEKVVGKKLDPVKAAPKSAPAPAVSGESKNQP